MSITAKTFWLWFGGIWVFCGLPFLIIGLYIGLQTFMVSTRLAAEGRTVDGMVLTKAITSSSSGSNRNSSPGYEVTFRFATPTGLYTGKADVTAEAWDALVEREAIRVTYIPDSPDAYRVEGQTNLWTLPVIFAVMGGIFTGLGAFVFHRAWSRLRTAARLQREGVPVDATIVEVRPANVRINGVQQWTARYEYRDGAGAVHTGSETFPPEEADAWKEGDRISVRYDRRRPDRSVWTGTS
jgi:hypothetical protein